MKKTLYVNISGRVFVINEDAYNLLKEYLDTLEQAFRNSEDSEVVNDIEARISEIFAEQGKDESEIVTLRDVEIVINRIGHPEELIEEEIVIEDPETKDVVDSIVTGASFTPPPLPEQPTPVKKKLFRNSNKGMIGGVCAGLSVYLGIDVTWVRLIMVALFFLSWSTISIIYVILWIVLPDARTPIQKMKMTGESPTLYNIGQSVTSSFIPEGAVEDPNDQRSDAMTVISKVLLIGLTIILLPLIIALGVGLIGCIFALIIFLVANDWGFPTNSMLASYEYTEVILGLLIAIGWILVIGVPLYLVLHAVLRDRTKTKFSKGTKMALLIVWLIGILTAAVSTGLLIKRPGNKDFNPIEISEKGIFIGKYSDDIEDEDEVNKKSVTINIDTPTNSMVITKSVQKDSITTSKTVEMKSDSVVMKSE